MNTAGFLKNLGSVSTGDRGGGGSYAYWKHRCEGSGVDGAELLKRRKRAQEKAERWKLIKKVHKGV